MEPPEQFHEIARANQQPILVPSGLGMERMRFYAWAIYGMGFAIAVVVAFVVRTQIKISDYDQLREKREVQIKALDDYTVSNNLVNAATQASQARIVESVSKNEKRLDFLQPKVEEMWFMKEHGMSNKEDFFIRHGFPAQNTPQADPHDK